MIGKCRLLPGKRHFRVPSAFQGTRARLRPGRHLWRSLVLDMRVSTSKLAYRFDHRRVEWIHFIYEING